MIYNGNSLITYLNTKKDFDAAISGTVYAPNQQSIGGGYLAANKEHYIGRIDDVRIFNRTVSIVEMNELYRAGGYQPE